MIDLSALDALDGELAAAVEVGLDQAAALGLAVARKAAGGGRVASTLHVERPGPFERVIASSDPGAAFLQNGRPAEVAHGKALCFVVNGTPLFRKQVGPVAPRPFLAAAGAELEAHAGELVEDALRGAT